MIQIEIHKCPYCGEEYKEQDDAQDCAEECHNATIEETITKNSYKCEYCDETYKRSSEAIKCETKHKEKEDRHYQKKEYLDGIAKLYEAGTQKEQKKLFETIQNKSNKKR